MTESLITQLHMVDVSKKNVTLRIALAMGKIRVGVHAFQLIKTRQLPKGDALIAAEIAGIQAVKNTAHLLPLCHPLIVDQVKLDFECDENNHSIIVYCQVTANTKTGVEMEALAGVNAALLTIYDLTKMVDPVLTLSEIRLLVKLGGKKGLWFHPEGVPEWVLKQFSKQKTHSVSTFKAALVTLSDRAASSVYEDQSGKLLKEALKEQQIDVCDYTILPDDQTQLEQHLKNMVNVQKPHFIITTGGTGVGLRDVTPEALHHICDRMIPGVGELLRYQGSQFTPYSWGSRSCAGVLKHTIIAALPGNPKAVSENLSVLLPLLCHLSKMIQGEQHD